MSELRIAVVGAGFMGGLHARTVAECAGASLGAVVDTSREAGEARAAAFGAVWASSVAEALRRDLADAYIVALPDRLHRDATLELLEAGRPVLVEKPLAHSLEAAQDMARAAARGGGRLMVGHLLRFDPRYVRAAQAVREGAIGEPLHASSGRFSLRGNGLRMQGPSSVCFYLGIHDIDALQWISGRDIERVFARRVSVLMPAAGVAGEDAILATCEMAGGMAGQLHFGWTLPQDAPVTLWARTEVFGSEGVVDLDVRETGLQLHSRGHTTRPDALHWPEVNGRITGDLAEEIRHFVAAVAGERAFPVSLDAALRNVAVSDAILRSVETGGPETVAPWSIG